MSAADDERPWWRRLDGAPRFIVERRARRLTRREVVVERLAVPFFAILGVAAWVFGHMWWPALWALWPLFRFAMLPVHQQRQILGRERDRPS